MRYEKRITVYCSQLVRVQVRSISLVDHSPDIFDVSGFG
jgi:hypothetical protein